MATAFAQPRAVCLKEASKPKLLHKDTCLRNSPKSTKLGTGKESKKNDTLNMATFIRFKTLEHLSKTF